MFISDNIKERVGSPLGFFKINKLILVTVLLFAIIIAIFLKVKIDFSSIFKNNNQSVESPPSNISLERIVNDFKRISQDFKARMGWIKSQLNIAVNSAKVNVSSDEIFKIEEKLKEKIKEKEQAELDDLILDITKVITEDWSYIIDTVSSDLIDKSVTRITFKNSNKCEHCLNEKECQDRIELSSQRVLDFYSVANMVEVIKRIEADSQKVLPGQCHPAIYFETTDYLIIDSCSNNLQCENITLLDSSIKDYLNQNINEKEKEVK